jgi:hypothetical protein
LTEGIRVPATITVVEVRDPAVAFASLRAFAMFVVDPDVVEINSKQQTHRLNE